MSSLNTVFVPSLKLFLTNINRRSLVRRLSLLGSGEVKETAYDDITLHLHDTDDLGVALQVFTTHGSLSGARLNEQKSKALWVNRPTDPASPLPAAVVVKILGSTTRRESSQDLDSPCARHYCECGSRPRLSSHHGSLSVPRASLVPHAGGGGTTAKFRQRCKVLC